MTKRRTDPPIEPSLNTLASLARKAAEDFVPVENSEVQNVADGEATQDQTSPLMLSKLALQVADELNQVTEATAQSMATSADTSKPENRPQPIKPQAKVETPSAKETSPTPEVETSNMAQTVDPIETDASETISQIDQLNEFAQAFQLDAGSLQTPAPRPKQQDHQPHSFADDDALLQLITCLDALKARHANDPKIEMLCDILECMVKKLSDELTQADS